MSQPAISPALGSRKVRHVALLAIMIVSAVSSFAKTKGSGDFNGDGRADLCIAVPTFTVGTLTDAGAVNCLYGSATGLQATGTPAAQLWTQNTVGLNRKAAANDDFGQALARGDFNNDGYDDLCIGIPHRTVSGTADVGAVDCIYGSSKGLQVTGNGGPSPQVWNTPSFGLVSESGMLFGRVLVAGDFNHDGYDDLCIAAIGATVSEQSGAGLVVCLFGSATGLTAIHYQLWDEATPGLGDTPIAFDAWGTTLVTGDFNNDGFDDLCVAAELAGNGFINCIYGSSSGLQALGGGAPASQSWYPGKNSLKGGGGTGFENFGSAMAVGDFNNDGYADVAVGSPEYPLVFGTIGAGRVNVLYGSPTGLQDTGTGAPDDQLWVRGSGSVKGTSVMGNLFGNALTAGDFNRDGYDDLCIGTPFDSSIATLGGSVNCLYGSETGLQATGTGGPDDQLWNQNSPGVLDVTETDDIFGEALSAGDFNGDGYFDLAVGVPEENNPHGAINVLYGSPTGLQATGIGAPASQFWDQASAGVPGTGGGLFGDAFSH